MDFFKDFGELGQIYSEHAKKQLEHEDELRAMARTALENLREVTPAEDFLVVVFHMAGMGFADLWYAALEAEAKKDHRHSLNQLGPAGCVEQVVETMKSYFDTAVSRLLFEQAKTKQG